MLKNPKSALAAVVAAGVLATALPAAAQQNRIREYENELEKRIPQRLEEYRLKRLEEKRNEIAQRDDDTTTTETSLEQLQKPFNASVNVFDSNSGEGQDVEIRVTMPIDEFMEFAPLAALEAAAVNHKFPVTYIFVREETTDRVGRVAFKDAEPIVGRHLAGDEDAVGDMKDALIWH